MAYAKDFHLASSFDLSYHECNNITTEELSSLFNFHWNSKIGICSECRPVYLEVEALSDPASDHMLPNGSHEMHYGSVKNEYSLNQNLVETPFEKHPFEYLCRIPGTSNRFGRGFKESDKDFKGQQGRLSENRYALKFVEDWPVDAGHNTAAVDSVHGDHKFCDTSKVSCISATSSLDSCDLKRMTALESALVKQELMHPAADCRLDRGRQFSLPEKTSDWRAALQEGIETLSAIQMVGGGSDHARYI
jgi:hypothetical protein